MGLESYRQHIDYLQHQTEAILAEHGFEALVLCGGVAQSRNRFDDQAWPLSPTPAYSHWCPLAEPNAYVVVRPGKRPTLIRTALDDFWEAVPAPDSDHFWSCFDVIVVEAGRVGDVLPGGRVAVVTRDPGAAPPGEVNPSALIAALDLTRTKKTEYELACLTEATRRALQGHRAVESRFRAAAVSDYEVAPVSSTDVSNRDLLLLKIHLCR